MSSLTAPPQQRELTPDPAPSPRVVVGEGLRLIAGYVREQPWAYGLAAAGAVVFTGAIVASAWVVGHITNTLVVPVLEAGEPVAGRLRTAVLLVLLVAVWKAAGIVVRRTAATWLAFGAQTRVRKRLIAHQMGLTLRWYGSRSVGDLLSVSDNDSRQATFVLHPLPYATGVLFLLVFTAVFVLVTDLWLGLAALALLALVLGLDVRGMWLTFEQMQEAQRRRGRVADTAHESFDGALTVKALGREDRETARFRQRADELRDQLVEVGRVWTAYRALTERLPALGTVLILLLGTVRVAGGALSAGELVRVAYLLSLLAVPIQLIGFLMWDIAESVAGWRRVREVMEVDDRIRYGSLPASTDGGGAPVTGRGVTFAYDRQLPVLADLHLDVPAGRTLAVVGPTAAGKSSLALLLARLWDPDDGAIHLDGRDLRALAAGAVPAEVAYVSQDTFLFDDTVAGNIALGAPLTQPDMEAAASLAGADGFIRTLPDGYDTRIGERGTSLSGGQQQRLALARALARRPRLLILDDATSAVDPRVEAAILRGLKRAELPSTIVVVAYRRSSIVLSDEVVYVAGGRVVAHGTHDQLVLDVPGYAALLEAYDVDRRQRRPAAAGDGRDAGAWAPQGQAD